MAQRRVYSTTQRRSSFAARLGSEGLLPENPTMGRNFQKSTQPKARQQSAQAPVTRNEFWWPEDSICSTRRSENYTKYCCSIIFNPSDDHCNLNHLVCRQPRSAHSRRSSDARRPFLYGPLRTICSRSARTMTGSDRLPWTLSEKRAGTLVWRISCPLASSCRVS